MNEKEFTIYYTDSKGNQGKADIEINLDEYAEMLAEKDSISDEDDSE